MKEKNEIKEWLSKGKPYEEGLLLLDKYSKNRNLQRMLRRVKKPEKLEYELRKISKIGKDLAVKLEKKKPKKQAPKEVKGKGFTKIIHEKSVKYHELPAELKEVYKNLKKLYKERSSYHEKAKLLTKQGADKKIIANLVQKLKDNHKEIREGWDKIDNYNPEDYKNESPEPKEPITNKRISANRKYISTNKKKLKADPEKWSSKIQERVDELIQAGENFKPEIVEELKDYGIKL